MELLNLLRDFITIAFFFLLTFVAGAIFGFVARQHFYKDK